MADNLRRAIQDLNLGINDEPVSLSVEICNAARRATQFSLMGRPTIPKKQNNKFQFVFPSEDLMMSVLRRGPWAYNERMLVVKRWNPGMDDTSLNTIPLWVQIRGIPLEFLMEPVIRNIGDRMGEVMLVDFNPETTGDVEFVRVQKNFQFTPGVNTLLKFRYERLKGFCELCGMITHDSGECVPAVEDDPINEEHDMDPEDEGHMQEDDDPVQEDRHQEGDQGNLVAGSNMALLSQFWSHAPMDVVRAEYESRIDPERSARKRKFVDELVEQISAEENVEKQSKEREVSDDDGDHVTLEMEERWSSECRFGQYGTVMNSGLLGESLYSLVNHSGGPSEGCAMRISPRSQAAKRTREESDVVDKFPVVIRSLSTEGNALKKIQRDYGQVNEEVSEDPVDRGAVGPVPPEVP
ncbi:hypothetical protein Bca4012_066326 [Brassica carinata]